jgi:serine/threonine protein kinase
LGEGTYGSVYRATDRHTGEAVAVKVINKNDAHAEVQGFSAAIIREAAILKSLKHENIIGLKEVVLSSRRAYIVTDLCFCDLRSFVHRLRGFGLVTVDKTDLKSFTTQILSAVCYCHDQRILHRDLKPDNILLDCARKHIKIADFGMARRVSPDQHLTGNCVTTWYRCPEIMLGDPRYGAPADIWSIGCIFAEMINLHPLFECSTEVECLITMFRLLGTPNEHTWHGISSLPHYHHFFPNWSSLPLARLVLPAPAAQLCPGALEFLGIMLRLDPAKRATAQGALLDSFLSTAATYPPERAESCSLETDAKDEQSRLDVSAEVAAAAAAAAAVAAKAKAKAKPVAAVEPATAEAAAGNTVQSERLECGLISEPRKSKRACLGRDRKGAK